MAKIHVTNKVILKELPNQVSSSFTKEQLSSKSHQCSFGWSDKCAHCDIAFDELKQKLLSSTEPTEENLNELKMKIEECLGKLEGFTFII
jgi:hypothetical protein